MKPITKIFTFLILFGSSSFQASANMAANQSKPIDSTLVKPVPQRPEDISPLLIGAKIPVIKIPAADGKLFNLNASITDKPTVLIFYRGGWCPFCNKELAGIQSIQNDLVKMGYQVIAISTDSPENLHASIDKHQLKYTLLSDANLAVSRQFGIAFKAPAAYEKILADGSGGKNVDKLLPVPSVFILDKSGVIRFEYINPDFKQRISPALLQSVALALNKENGLK